MALAPDNKPLNAAETIAQHLTPTETGKQTTFFHHHHATASNMDGWVIKTKKLR